ncbi:esterase [Pseudonocardiaceae bacterium YIM PH 21723]|nr:esterase [Pseudonocardiaceae bacterium YIM PH 21723]
MGNPLDWSIVAGVFPTTISWLGLLGGLYLLIRPGRAWWIRAVLPAFLVAALGTLAAVWITDHWWRPWPEPVPDRVTFWSAVGVFAVGLTVAALITGPWSRRVLAVLAVALVLATVGIKINVVFQSMATVRNVLGLPDPGEELFETIAKRTALTDNWKPPANLPANGAVAKVEIPGTHSGFRARPGYVYVPPAYLVDPKPRLPVLVLLNGQPGEPRQWLDGGRLASRMNDFAAKHQGLAPVVIIPDDLGSTIANPLCVDGPLGNVETYLATDVPAWVKENLQVDEDPRHWAIAGYSHGGTCALQLGTRKPEVYPNFITVSGQEEPTLGDRKSTVDKGFGGDEKRFRQYNPLDIMAARRFPDSTGVWVVGAGDKEFRRYADRTRAAAVAAGMRTELFTPVGGHSMQVFSPGVMSGVGALAGQLGLVR